MATHSGTLVWKIPWTDKSEEDLVPALKQYPLVKHDTAPGAIIRIVRSVWSVQSHSRASL